MATIPVSIETSKLDIFIAVGTVGAAVVAVLALWITVCQARAAQKQLEEERILRRADQIRHERVPQLMRLAELHMTVQHAGPGRPVDTARIRALLWILPEGMARRLKYEYGVNFTDAERRVLIGESTNGELPAARYPEDEVYKELFADIQDAGSGVIREASKASTPSGPLAKLLRMLCPIR